MTGPQERREVALDALAATLRDYDSGAIRLDEAGWADRIAAFFEELAAVPPGPARQVDEGDGLRAAWPAMDEAYTELLDDMTDEGRRARIILKNAKEDIDRAALSPALETCAADGCTNPVTDLTSLLCDWHEANGPETERGAARYFAVVRSMTNDPKLLAAIDAAEAAARSSRQEPDTGEEP